MSDGVAVVENVILAADRVFAKDSVVVSDARTDTLRDTTRVCDDVLVCVCGGVALWTLLSDALGVAERDTELDRVRVGGGVTVGVAEGLLLSLVLWLDDAVRRVVSVGDGEGETVAVRVADGDALSDGVRVGGGVIVGVVDADAASDGVAEAESMVDGVGESVAVRLRDGVFESERRDGDGETDAVSDGVGDADVVGDSEAERVIEGDVDGGKDAESDGVAVRDADGVSSCVSVTDLVAVSDALRDTLRVGVAGGVMVRVSVLRSVEVTELDTERVMVAEAVRDAEGLRERV